MVHRRRIVLAFFIALVASIAYACNIPVFRYALENWQPDPYRVAVVHRGPLSDEQQTAFRHLQQASSNPTRPANVAVFDLDLDAAGDENGRREIPSDFEALVRSEFSDKEIEQPTIALYFPKGAARSVWQASLNKENADHLVDSPTRQQVTTRIADGQSAVWVLIKSGNAEKDAVAEQTLLEKLKLANDEVVLPDQSLIESEEEYRAENPIDLRVEFSLLTVSRDDPVEQPFVAMLLNSEEDLADFDEPIAVPIFGRGRTYFALVGQGINQDTILENCAFVCGACSCQVKQANPGIDTLMAFDWAAKITGSAMREPELPELTGFGPFEVDSSIKQTASNSIDSDDTSETVPTVNASTLSGNTNSKPMTDDASANDTSAPTTTQQSIAESPTNESTNEAPESETPVPDYEQSILKWAIGGTTIAALFVFVVSFLFRRPA